MKNEFKKMDGKSKDVVAERLTQLKTLIPEAFTEGKIDFDALKGALGEAVDSTKNHYSFTWNKKEEYRAFALRPSMGTLRPCAAESSGKDGTPGKFDSENLYIEGDNLEVLKLLQGSYYGKVKMIYIDPPYNTGKDFVYEDDFHDSVGNYKAVTGQVDSEGRSTRTNAETSGRYHTDWLNMMFPRLLLARNLLRDDGLIFISIDDNEVANMRKLCDEVFGEVNMVNGKCFVSHIPNGTNKGLIARAHEYVLAYAKDITKIKSFNRLDNGGDQISEERCTNTPTDKNPLSEIRFKKGLRFEGGDATFVGKVGDKEPIFIEGVMAFENGMLKDDVVLKSSWRNRAQVLEVMDKGMSYDEQGQEVFEVYFTKEGKPKYRKRLTCFSPKSVQVFKRYDFESKFDDLSFENPKPVSLVEFFVKLCCSDDDIVCDFFAGSATTANAVMKVNDEMGFGLRMILVQLPENLDLSLAASDGKARTFIEKMIQYLDGKSKEHFLTEIGKERWRLAGEMVLAKGKRHEMELKMDASREAPTSAQDIGFKVFKLDTSNLIPWNPNPEDLEKSLLAAVDNAVEGRTVDDILYEVLLKCNLPLTLPIAKEPFGENTINVIGEGALMICLDRKIPATVAEEMIRLRDEKYKPVVPMQVVFLDNGFTDKDKANAIVTLKQAGVEEKAIMSI